VDADSKNLKMLKYEVGKLESSGTFHAFWLCSHHSLNKVVQTIVLTSGRGVVDGLTSFAKLVRSGQGFWSRLQVAVRMLVHRDLRVYHAAPPAAAVAQRKLVADYFVPHLRVRLD
jgi:hypothetical protein